MTRKFVKRSKFFFLESGSVVFNPYKQRDKLALERIQRMFTKRVFMRSHLLRYADTPPPSVRNEALKLDLLVNRRKRADAKMLRKILAGKCGTSLQRMFKFRPFAYSSRRGRSRIIIPRATKMVRRHSFVHRTSIMIEETPHLAS